MFKTTNLIIQKYTIQIIEYSGNIICIVMHEDAGIISYNYINIKFDT